MPYVADPWSNSTPTNANTVKDVVPAEIIALKQVNLDRLRLVANGMVATPRWTVTTGSAVATCPVAIAQTILNKGAYTAAQNTGSVYTADQAGWFRVMVRMSRSASNQNYPTAWADTPTLSLYEQLVIQKSVAATPTTWVDQHILSVPGNKYVGTDSDAGMELIGHVQLAINDNVRFVDNMIMNANWAGASGFVFTPIPVTSSKSDSFSIEFMRP